MDALYLTAAALYILKSSLSGVLFHIPWPHDYEYIVQIFACAVIFIKLGYTKAYSGKEWLVCVLTSTVLGFSWLSTRYDFLIDTALLTLGAAGMPYRKILKTGFWTGLFVLLLGISGAITGCIPDLVYMEEAHCRHAFGIAYPTDFAAHVVFLAITGWALYGGTLTFFPAVCALGLAFFVYCYCSAYCSAIVLCLLTAAVLYHLLGEKLGRQGNALFLMTKRIDRLLIYAAPFCAGVMILLTFLYGTGNELLNSLNILLSHRLYLGWEAINTYGLKPFGTAFELIGSGGGIARSWIYKYNFVDSSYILILVRYGFMTLLAVLLQFIWLGRKALKNGRRAVALGAALIAVHSMIEHHLPEIAYNLFLLLPFADFTDTDTAQKAPVTAGRRLYAACAAYAAGIVFAVLIFPRAVIYAQTMVDILLLYTEERHLLFIAAAAIGLLLGWILLRLLTQIASSFIRRVSVPRWKYASIAVIIIFFFGIFLRGEQVLRKTHSVYEGRVESDKPVIEALLASNEPVGKVYVNHIPEVYKREFRNLSYLLYAGEGLAFKKNTTLITEDTEETYTLMSAGFSYGILASGHAVYTNSEPAKKILTASGVSLTDYYSRQRTVDLEDMAEINSLEISDGGALLLRGHEHSLYHGSGVTIYEGTLRVTYKLRLTSAAFYEGVAATAKISSDWGAKLWNQQDIPMEAFDENGQCVYTIDTDLVYSSPGMEFLLIAADGVELEIQEITYGKVEETVNGYN